LASAFISEKNTAEAHMSATAVSGWSARRKGEEGSTERFLAASQFDGTLALCHNITTMHSATARVLSGAPLLRSAAPLYRQIAQILRDAILDGRIRVGTTLPTELELERRFAVSRVTVRQALQQLEVEGLIRRRRAKGTVVVSDKPHGGESWAFDSLQDIVAFGEQTQVRLLSFEQRRPTRDVAAIFSTPPSMPLPCVHGVRLLKKAPLSEFRFWLTPRAAGLVSRVDLNRSTLFLVLESRLGVRLAEARQSVWAELAGSDVARTLRTRSTAPVLAIQRVYMTEGNVPIEVAISRFRADAYRLHQVLRRRERGGTRS
jgi:GntR family transcriptional regulator